VLGGGAAFVLAVHSRGCGTIDRGRGYLKSGCGYLEMVVGRVTAQVQRAARLSHRLHASNIRSLWLGGVERRLLRCGGLPRAHSPAVRRRIWRVAGPGASRGWRECQPFFVARREPRGATFERTSERHGVAASPKSAARTPGKLGGQHLDWRV
jgi:hypothetical protein